MAREPYLSIVVPAFNEEQRVADCIKKLSDYLSRQSYSAELIFVDDGSHDRTVEIINQTIGTTIPHTLFKNDQNRGKGFSVNRGFLAAKGEFVLFTDTDLSAPIEELGKLFTQGINQGNDIAIGSRGLKTSSIGARQSFLRERMGKTFNLMIRLITGLDLHDTQCGFKLFRRSSCATIFERQTVWGWAFDVELLLLAQHAKLKIAEVPVRWEHSEGSKLHILTDATRMFLELIKIRLQVGAAKK